MTRPTAARLAKIRKRHFGCDCGECHECMEGECDVRPLLAKIDALQKQLDARSAGFEEWWADYWSDTYLGEHNVKPWAKEAWQAAIASQEPLRDALAACVAALEATHCRCITLDAIRYDSGHNPKCKYNEALALAKAAMDGG